MNVWPLSCSSLVIAFFQSERCDEKTPSRNATKVQRKCGDPGATRGASL
jgi:hypothetical protein